MEATITTLTDKERLNALNLIYKKGMSTPKEELAFSSEKLVYLKPFISKLQTEVANEGIMITNLSMVRQVIDELLWDIWEEIEAACARSTEKKADRLAAEYGLQPMTAAFEQDFYLTHKVA